MPLCIGDTSLTPSTADEAVFELEHVQIMACAGGNRSELRRRLDPTGIGTYALLPASPPLEWAP
jgi:hypothetical protein